MTKVFRKMSELKLLNKIYWVIWLVQKWGPIYLRRQFFIELKWKYLKLNSYDILKWSYNFINYVHIKKGNCLGLEKNN